MKKLTIMVCMALLLTGILGYQVGYFTNVSYATDTIDSKEDFQEKLGMNKEKEQDLETSIPKTLYMIVSIAAGCAFPYFLFHIIKSGMGIARNKKSSGGQSEGWDDLFASLKGAGITFAAWGILTVVYIFSQKMFEV